MPTCVDIVCRFRFCRYCRNHNVDTWEVMEDQSRSGHRASIIDLSLSRTPSTLGTSVKYAVSRIDTIFNTCFRPQNGLRTLQTLPVDHSSELLAPLLCPLLAAEDGREYGGRGPHLDRGRVDISPYLHIYISTGCRTGLPYMGLSTSVSWPLTASTVAGSSTTRDRKPIRSPYRPRF